MINSTLKKISILAIVISFLGTLVPISISADQTEQAASQTALWTTMYYLCGDNKLSSSQQQHLNQIKSVGSSNEVSIAILVDYDGTDDTNLYYLDGNDLDEQEWSIESDMADPKTLQDFINTAMNDLPAEHYFLQISSNKGSGWQGVCLDEHGDGTMITMPEISNVLSEVTGEGSSPLDLIAVETCLGGNLAFSYELSPFSKYYVGYADCGLIGAWPFQACIQSLVNNPTMSTNEFASAIVNSFIPQDIPQYKMKTAIGAFDLTKIDEVTNGINQLGNYFLNDINSYKEKIISALDSVRIYGEFWGIDYFIDLVQFLNALEFEDSEGIGIKTDLLYSINNLVISKNHLAEDDSEGFNFYFPRRADDYNHALRYDSGILPSSYEKTLFAIDTSWDEFLRELLRITDNSPPSNPTITGTTKGKAGQSYTYQIRSTDSENDEISYFIDWGDESNTGWLDFSDSAESIDVSKSWDEKGSYAIQVKAKDEHGAESDWETLEISMPKQKESVQSFVMFLFGLIEEIEYNNLEDFRFLPVKLLSFSFGNNQATSVQLLHRTNGGFPCCGYIDPDEFYGLVTEGFICGIWIL